VAPHCGHAGSGGRSVIADHYRRSSDMMRRMRIVVIGGTVFMGRVIVRRLVGRGHQVAVMHRMPRSLVLLAVTATPLVAQMRPETHSAAAIAAAVGTITEADYRRRINALMHRRRTCRRSRCARRCTRASMSMQITSSSKAPRSRASASSMRSRGTRIPRNARRCFMHSLRCGAQ